MNLPLFDQAPAPKDKILIEELEMIVYPDRFRVFVHIRVSLFQERPNLMIIIREKGERVAAELTIIETMHHDMEFTTFLRGKHDPAGEYTLTAELFYETRNPPQDSRSMDFTVPAADQSSDQ